MRSLSNIKPIIHGAAFGLGVILTIQIMGRVLLALFY